MKVLSPDEIIRLTTSERLALIGDLWDSLGDGPQSLTRAQADELDRRLESLEQDLTEALSWDDLKAELAARAP